MRIDEFILARIAEDEAVAANWQRKGAVIEQPADIDPDVYDDQPWVRVLAECEAKQRIMELHPPEPLYIEEWTMSEAEPREVYAGTRIPTELRLLAAVYAAHPDYDPVWEL